MEVVAQQPSSFPASALHGDWELAYFWAEKHGIREQLFRVIATLKIWDRPNLFGSFLAQITLTFPRFFVFERVMLMLPVFPVADG